MRWALVRQGPTGSWEWGAPPCKPGALIVLKTLVELNYFLIRHLWVCFLFAMSGLHGSNGMHEDAIFVSDDSTAESGSAKELAELKAMLRRQDAEMGRLRTQLAATEIEKRKETEVPDLNMAGIEDFLKKDWVTVWLKDACIVLKRHVTAVPTPSRPSDVGGKQGEQLSIGGTLAYRMWKVLNVAHATYVKRYSPGDKSGPKG